jgi:hypothetical protein
LFGMFQPQTYALQYSRLRRSEEGMDDEVLPSFESHARTPP